MSRKGNYTWKYSADGKDKLGHNLEMGNYIPVDFQIGSHIFKEAILATGYPFFAQLHLKDFRKLEREGLIRNVKKVPPYRGIYKQRFKENPPKLLGYGRADKVMFFIPDFDEISSSDSDVHFFNWDLKTMQKELRWKKMGICDFVVEGENGEAEFTDMIVTEGPNMYVGCEFIQAFSDWRMMRTKLLSYFKGTMRNASRKT